MASGAELTRLVLKKLDISPNPTRVSRSPLDDKVIREVILSSQRFRRLIEEAHKSAANSHSGPYRGYSFAY